MSLKLSQTLYRKVCCLDIEAEYGGTDGLAASQPQYDLEVMTGLCVSDLRIMCSSGGFYVGRNCYHEDEPDFSDGLMLSGSLKKPVSHADSRLLS